jgi:GDPmannose 4,6-dehydratase
MKKALLTGITGQDGSYLAELLLQKGYDVHGVIRRNQSNTHPNIEAIVSDLTLHLGDLSDSNNLRKIVEQVQPDEIYNLAAQSHVHMSFEAPELTSNVNALGVLRFLEVVRNFPHIKFYQASTSELYGEVQEIPQNERTPFCPKSPYGIAKQFAYWMTINYRESYNLFASNGILFNHESPRRGENFVTRKITLGLAKIMAGENTTVKLGNLDAKRDWGHAEDYVEGMWLMLQQNKPGDYVLATGEQHSVREFCEIASKFWNVDLDWIGFGIDEKGVCRKTGKVLFEVNSSFYRPSDVNTLLGDSSLARRELGWQPKYNFNSLVTEMCASDWERIKKIT